MGTIKDGYETHVRPGIKKLALLLNKVVRQLNVFERAGTSLQHAGKPASIIEKLKLKDGTTRSINNAGLIILHPFLATLMTELSLVKSGNWINLEAQHAAVYVTACLVNGEAEYTEHELVFNKLICGMAVGDSLPALVELPPRTVQCCEDVLTKVIAHWSILENISINGLRESFLQRNGSLSIVGNDLLLKVERKSSDVLLDQIPWGISFCRLPWMKGAIYTEW